MGNKDNGRAIMNLPFDQYSTVMGADVTNIMNTGISFTNYAVQKYYKMFRDQALFRIEWKCDQIPDYEMRLIEWNLFHYGKCVMLKPSITRQGIRYKTDKLKIFQYTATELNTRTGQPKTISVFNQSYTTVAFDINYSAEDCVIFTDEYVFPEQTIPFNQICWEYACKMYELDLMFNANSHKQRMPVVFNNGTTMLEKDGSVRVIANKGISIAELMRSAYGRNEQFVEVPESMVGVNGFLHEPKYFEFKILDILEAQKRIKMDFMELLGLYTLKEKGGVYTVKDIQKNGDETGDYITDIMKYKRLISAKEAVEKFGINITIKVI